MLKTLAVIAVVVAVIVAGVLIYATTRPDSFTVKRTASIKAPPDRLFSEPSDERTRRFLRRIVDAGRL